MLDDRVLCKHFFAEFTLVLSFITTTTITTTIIIIIIAFLCSIPE